MNPQTPSNEVAMLRELLEIAIEELSGQAYTEISEAYAALAPAPEETHEGVTMAEWYGGFAKIKSTEPVTEKDTNVSVKEPAIEWRDLGEDEMPLEGDIEDLEEIADDDGSAFEYDARRIAKKTAYAIRYLRDEIAKLKNK